MTLHGRNRSVLEESLPLLIFVKYSNVRNILQRVLELYKKDILVEYRRLASLCDSHFMSMTDGTVRCSPSYSNAVSALNLQSTLQQSAAVCDGL